MQLSLTTLAIFATGVAAIAVGPNGGAELFRRVRTFLLYRPRYLSA